MITSDISLGYYVIYNHFLLVIEWPVKNEFYYEFELLSPCLFYRLGIHFWSLNCVFMYIKKYTMEVYEYLVESFLTLDSMGNRSHSVRLPINIIIPHHFPSRNIIIKLFQNMYNLQLSNLKGISVKFKREFSCLFDLVLGLAVVFLLHSLFTLKHA